jgi:S1-C subfamily serine protease
MTSGGSSGSPVIDIHGNVVALNAGSFSQASVALFHPLEHPVKSLKHLVQDATTPPSRGTVQAKWELEPFHECQTLGVTDEWITQIQEKFPEENNMLVVKSVRLYLLTWTKPILTDSGIARRTRRSSPRRR